MPISPPEGGKANKGQVAVSATEGPGSNNPGIYSGGCWSGEGCACIVSPLRMSIRMSLSCCRYMFIGMEISYSHGLSGAVPGRSRIPK